MKTSRSVGKKCADEINALILVGFSNGSVKLSKVGCLTYTSYKSSECVRKRPKKILVVNNGRLTYVGNNFTNESTNVTSSILKVALYNKSKKEMTIYDVDLFYLKPLLKCSLKINNTEQNFFQKVDDLSLAFGSKSMKTFVNSRNKQGQSSLSSLESISIKTMDEELKSMTSNTQQQTSSIYPQPNGNATNVSQIYNLNDILSERIYEALDADSNIFLNITRQAIELWKHDKKYCEFVTNFLEFNLTSMDVHKAKLLLYFHYMTSLLQLTSQDWRKKDPVTEIPQLLKKELMDQFVINKKMSQTLKDKLVSHALILALILNNYFVNANVFASSVKYSLTRLVSIAYALGCHVNDKRNENTKYIVLKLPLYQPKQNFKRKNR